MSLKDVLKDFPLSPGVYMFLDEKGEILYIGRATSLRRRVSNYFTKRIDNRIAEMVQTAYDLKYQETETVLDAIILEANLIKKFWPKYNVKDRDDRSFIYVVMPKADYPHPIIVRGRELKKFSAGQSKIFGPYQSYTLVRHALRIIRKIFPYSTCKPLSGKSCFDHQIGLCPGICIDAISKKDYQKNIRNIELLLSGKKTRLMSKLKKENPEQAVALSHFQEVSLLSSENGNGGGANRIEGYDISHLTGKETYGSMVVFTNGEPDTDQYRLFKVKEAPANDDLRSLQEVISRRLKHVEWPLPDIMLIDGGKPQIDYIYQNIINNGYAHITIVGISKLAGDALVFPPKTKDSIKMLAKSYKKTLLHVRDEAHRFGRKASRRNRSTRFNRLDKNR